MSTIGERLKLIRESVDYARTQKLFAESIGVTQASLSDIEKGVTKGISTPLQMLLELKHNVNIGFLLTGEGDMFKSDSSHTDCAKESTAIDKEQDHSAIYERMIEKKDKRIEELALMVGNLQKEVEILKQDKKNVQEVVDALTVAERLRFTGTDDQ